MQPAIWAYPPGVLRVLLIERYPNTAPGMAPPGTPPGHSVGKQCRENYVA